MSGTISRGENATVAWKIVCALIVGAFVAALGWFINWRSAPPPPPPLPASLLSHQ